MNDLSRLAVNGCVARRAKRNQVFFGIVAGLTAKLLVMNFKIRHGAAGLASPAIPAEYFVAEFFVWLGIKPQARAFWSYRIHDAFPVK